jgi:hypothetical protein
MTALGHEFVGITLRSAAAVVSRFPDLGEELCPARTTASTPARFDLIRVNPTESDLWQRNSPPRPPIPTRCRSRGPSWLNRTLRRGARPGNNRNEMKPYDLAPKHQGCIRLGFSPSRPFGVPALAGPQPANRLKPELQAEDSFLGRDRIGGLTQPWLGSSPSCPFGVTVLAGPQPANRLKPGLQAEDSFLGRERISGLRQPWLGSSPSRPFGVPALAGPQPANLLKPGLQAEDSFLGRGRIRSLMQPCRDTTAPTRRQPGQFRLACR